MDLDMTDNIYIYTLIKKRYEVWCRWSRSVLFLYVVAGTTCPARRQLSVISSSTISVFNQFFDLPNYCIVWSIWQVYIFRAVWGSASLSVQQFLITVWTFAPLLAATISWTSESKSEYFIYISWKWYMPHSMTSMWTLGIYDLVNLFLRFTSVTVRRCVACLFRARFCVVSWGSATTYCPG